MSGQQTRRRNSRDQRKPVVLFGWPSILLCALWTVALMWHNPAFGALTPKVRAEVAAAGFVVALVIGAVLSTIARTLFRDPPGQSRPHGQGQGQQGQRRPRRRRSRQQPYQWGDPPR